MKVKIVGCGLSGITAAILLQRAGHYVEIFETRNHIGGNCYDSNLNGVVVHNYGPHIFHTNDHDVWAFLNQYTEFKHFKYAPKGITSLGEISLPYSRSTVHELGRELSSQEIIDVIYRDYSEKQWGVSFDEISTSIIKRVPILKDVESPSWYGDELYQGIPSKGYTHMMMNMLDGIKVNLGVEALEWKKVRSDHTIFTGKIDEYFDHQHGHLPYRSLTFEHTVTPNKLQHHAYNYCTKQVPCTRKYDHSYFLDQHEALTVVTTETPNSYNGTGIPFYPIVFGSGQETYNEKYKELAKRETHTTFVGRLATYKYLDMWVAIKQTMNTINHLITNS